MVRAYFALPTLKRAESFAAWLFGIADRVGREMCRAARRQAESLQRKPAAPGAENGTSRVELADASLRQAVNDLPEPYREVVLRRFYGGQSCAEIGSSLRVSLGTITSRLSRAYLLLRKALRECEDEGEHRS
jgi:RNA polymerase sigma-70 factor (ECF subfamily)